MTSSIRYPISRLFSFILYFICYLFDLLDIGKSVMAIWDLRWFYFFIRALKTIMKRVLVSVCAGPGSIGHFYMGHVCRSRRWTISIRFFSSTFTFSFIFTGHLQGQPLMWTINIELSLDRYVTHSMIVFHHSETMEFFTVAIAVLVFHWYR